MSQYDSFLSYRVKTDKERVRAVYDCLTLLSVDDDGHPPAVFFDSKCLETGQEWDMGFARALGASNVFVPLISEESLKSIQDKRADEDDNVVLEWALALEVWHRRGVLALHVAVCVFDFRIWGCVCMCTSRSTFSPACVY